MNYYAPEIPNYPSYPRNGLSSALNNSKGTKFLQSVSTSNNLNQYNSELTRSSKYANSDYSFNYKVKKSDANINFTQNTGEDRFEADELHINNIGGNITATVYSLIPEWINYSYDIIQCKKSENEYNPFDIPNKYFGTGENHYDGNIVNKSQEEYGSVGNRFANGINTMKTTYHGSNSNNNNNFNNGNKRPRHFFCFSCNQFKPRSTKARFKVCKHVSCYHCLRKALHVEYWAAKNDIWDKCRAECPFCHISLDWTKMKPYIVLSLEAKQFPLMSLCDAEERQGEAFQVIQSFFPRGVPSHIIYGNKIDFSVKPKVTQILFGHYLELINSLGSYEQFFQTKGESLFCLNSTNKFLELENLNLSDFKKNDGLKSFNLSKNSNASQCMLNNSGSNITNKFEVHSQSNTESNYYSYATSCTSASTTTTRTSTATNTSTTATINTTTAPSCNTTAARANIATSVSSTLESEGEVNTEYEAETETEEGKREGEQDGNVAWTRNYDIYPDIFVSWRRSVLYPLV
ncbi:RING finger containing [Cryptosporidium sp. chipmunk genotype I]|uniref:RING finger containing n=1 Tax=Cryptosporidium sp. chipmunk genotype I TaxID=1280935 RepID=UPI00351A9A40|nr:RING finger containing [Cryptosporidium sp. chipmunk genotype I]